MATLPAWKQLHNTLRRAAVSKGYTTLFPLGGKQTQTFEFRKGAKPTAIVAFRDVAKKDGYARPDRLWIEGLDLVLERYVALHGSHVKLPPAFAIVIDNMRSGYVVVPIGELLQLYLRRLPKPHADDTRWRTFTVEVRGNAYFLVMLDDLPAHPLPDVNSLSSIIAVL